MFRFNRIKSLCRLLLFSAILHNTFHIFEQKEDLTESGERTVATPPPAFDTKVKVFTVVRERTNAFLRYMRSARVYDIEVTPLGLNEKWKDGEMKRPAGGFKISLLREAIRPLKEERDTIILYTDGYDVVFTTGLAEIVQKFKKSDSKLLFSAEKYCWPDPGLASKYPAVEPKASPYLSSSAFVGYAPQVWSIVEAAIGNTDDDQLYYTKVFLNEEMRRKLDMKLDTNSTIFQNLNGAKDDVKLDVDLKTKKGLLKNINFLTTPSIIHGTGGHKDQLNAFANYFADTFNPVCLVCQENHLELTNESDLPIVSLALIVNQPVPFFDIFLNNTASLKYPKNRMHLFLYSGQEFHDSLAKSHLKHFKKEYLSSKIVLSTDRFDEKRAKKLALRQAKQKDADYIFFINADVQIDDPEVLCALLNLNKTFVAPVVSKYDELWSNFWVVVSTGGYYTHYLDYVDIVNRDIIGMWNVAYVSSIYLIKKTAFKHISYDHQYYYPDMAMCDSLRKSGVHLYIINDRIYGHLVRTEGFDITVARPDFYTLFTNKYDWIKKYIHPNFSQLFEANYTYLQPCTDVFWLPIASDDFCDDLVAIMETYGKWSNGTYEDERMDGGYETVPTRDIYMQQVGLDSLWLQFLNLFIRPLQEKVFYGYSMEITSSRMSFVVRYRPDEQPYLRPHHDASVYTINIALNHAGIDYEGGGCHFLRYNCSVTATKKGWMLMHPGRLTHIHEGLHVTNGTRYIMITFIDS